MVKEGVVRKSGRSEAIRVCETHNPHWASVETTIQALPKPILEKDPCPAVFRLV